MLEYPFPAEFRVSSPYGERVHPVTGKTGNHNGTDYATPSGTPILAPEDGIVKFIGEDERSGIYIGIQGKFLVSFAHLSGVVTAKGVSVRAGDLIAISGNTGQSTGPHTHVRVRESGQNIDPETVISPPREEGEDAGPLVLAAAALALL